jgi:hypothetical protein
VIYLDSSALVKLVVSEPETAELRAWLARRRQSPHATSDLARVEVARAVMRSEPTALLQAHQVVARLHKVVLSEPVLTTAAALQPPTLRSLDAIHLASALAVRRQLRAFVAYDDRLQDAARQLGLPVEQPGS